MKYIVRLSTLFIFWPDWISSVQNGSNLIKLDIWWNNHWNISSDFQLYLFFLDWIRSLQKGSKWIKLDQIRFLMKQLLKYIIRFSTLLFFIRLNQICPKLIKMDQTWSNLIFDETIIEIYHQIFNFIYFLIRLNQLCPEWIKMGQTWSN